MRSLKVPIIHEIVLPDATPDYEWVRGRALQKASPATIHAFVQSALLKILDTWVAEYRTGWVKTEWRVRILPAGSNERRPLTPDVAFISTEQLRDISRRSQRDVQYPPLAPALVFEVISDSDEPADVQAKRRDYLAAGSLCVVEVYPTRTLVAWSSPTSSIQINATGRWSDPRFPGLEIGVPDLFAEYERFLEDLGD